MHSIEINCFLCYPKTILFKPSSIQAHQRPGLIPPWHLLNLLEAGRWCIVYSQAGKGNRTFVTCSLCDVAHCFKKKNIKIDYVRNHFKFFFLLTYLRDTCVPAKFLTGGKSFGKTFGKHLIVSEILQICEISKNYLKQLWLDNKRVKIVCDL